jgi:hypothetical protein
MFKALVGALVVLAALAVFGAPRAVDAARQASRTFSAWQQRDHAEQVRQLTVECEREGGHFLAIPSSVSLGECLAGKR